MVINSSKDLSHDAGNSDMPEYSHEVLPVSGKVKVEDTLRDHIT